MPKYKFTEIAINSTEKKKPTEADKDTYIGLEHLDSGTLTVSRWGADVAPIGEKLIMKKGDVLFGKRRAYQKKVGIAPFDGIFSAHGMVLRPRENVITKEYFPLFISSDYFLNEAIRISVGSLSPTVNWKDLKELEFFIPTIEEQRRITPLVWAAIETKNAYKTLISRTDDLVKSQFIEMFGDPEKNPKGWDYIKLGDISFITKLAGFEYTKYIQYQDEGDIIMIRGLNCKGTKLILDDIKWIDKETSDMLPRSKLFKGDIVITYVGTVGEIGLIDKDDSYHLAPNVAKLSLNDKEKNNPMFWAYMLMASRDYVIRFATSTTQAALNMDKIRKIGFINPPVELQNKFVAFLEQSDKSKFVVSNRNLSRCLETKKTKCDLTNCVFTLAMETGSNQRISQKKEFD